ncbi:hypothetical protein Aperf_G00000045894 [Anoplocephala perfoliata]
MAQKLLTPVKMLPQQIQNPPFITKLQDLASGRQTGSPACHCASVYGILGQPVALAYDQDDLNSLPCLLVLNKQVAGFTFLDYLNNISIRIIYKLLLGYAGGTAIVAQPQPIPVDVEAPPIAVTSTSEITQSESTERPEEAETEKKPTVEPEVASEAARDGDPDSVAKSPPSKQQSPLK